MIRTKRAGTAMALILALVMTVVGTDGLVAYADEASVTALTVATAALEAEGGEVELSVEGTGLSADNWDISATASVKDSEFDVTNKLKIIYKDKSESGVTAVVPENPMKNNLEITFTAKAGGSTATAKVSLAKETRSFADLGEPKSVELTDADTVTATFDTDIEAEADAWKKIYIANYSNTEEGRIDMDENSSVTAEGKVLKLKFSESLNLTAQSALYINKGALKLGTDYNSAFKWFVSSKPTITGVDFEKDVFDSKGGHVVANLTGVKVGSVQNVTALVYEAGNNTEATEIETTIEDGKVTFDVPANTGETTKSYVLNVKVDGVAIYEGAGLDQAKMAVVSVMPEGADPEAQTLSCLTITGNNKIDADSNNKEITVNVENQVGSLKTVLRLFGTNLDASKTEVRAIDENGVLWPVYHIPECDGTIRFVSVSGMNGNGVLGNGNTQLIEVLPPRYAGTNKTYTIQVAIDGVHFEDACKVKLTVMNEAIQNEAEFVSCGKDDIKDVVVSYCDQETGEPVAEDTVFKGYSCSMVRAYDIKPAEVEGYELAKSPEIDLDNEWVGEGKAYKYEYVKIPAEPIKSVELGATAYYYDGKTKSPKVTVKDADGNILAEGTDYEVSGASAVKPGKYTVKVKGIGKYNGTLEKSYKISVKPSKVKKLVAGKKSFKVTATKLSSAYVTGYQVKYSRYSSMKKSKTSTIGTKASAVTKSVKKLKAKKYYVQVRAYKTIGGKKYYSSWSAKKAVKTR